MVTHRAYEEKGRTAAPALPHGTPNQKRGFLYHCTRPFFWSIYLKWFFRMLPRNLYACYNCRVYDCEWVNKAWDRPCLPISKTLRKLVRNGWSKALLYRVLYRHMCAFLRYGCSKECVTSDNLLSYLWASKFQSLGEIWNWRGPCNMTARKLSVGLVKELYDMTECS